MPIAATLPTPTLDTLWFTRCPVPTASGIAFKLGWLGEEFARDIRSVPSPVVGDEPLVGGSSASLVDAILRGTKPCKRGASHNIAVYLGLKRGQAVAKRQPFPAQRAAAQHAGVSA